MHQILMIGAGRSASTAIKYFLDNSQSQHWQLTIAESDIALAQKKINGHPNGKSVLLDATDDAQRKALIAQHDIVVSLLPPALHILVAMDCVSLKKNLVTASYISAEIQALHTDALRAGIILMNECGLDPGIDHMSAMRIIDDLHHEGCAIHLFKSYCGGLVAPESNTNPWGYKFTWNPRNVILAGQSMATFLQNGKQRYLPFNRIFDDIEQIEIDGMGKWDGYANRDSLSYRTIYRLQHIDTMLRGTLRYAGYSHAWNILVQLGYTDDKCVIDNSENMTYAELTEALLPSNATGSTLQDKVASVMPGKADKDALEKVAWCGLFENQKIGIKKATPAAALQKLLEEKWRLNPGDKDMILMQHKFEYTDKQQVGYTLTSDFILKGDDTTHTAMSKTVGLPLAITTKLILQNKIASKGLQLPVTKEFYAPVLDELQSLGICFVEKTIKK
ncbi:MAG: saccharopine dehydrogenase NADP-binding domain-containing protein [Bacteroidetes bacterium]|nr:saccharopine dehydrogenase NADP-binding domain-containing protein [Bacteroidota bacterium]